jgi:hypothetical protein
MDRLATKAVLARGTIEDLQNPDCFAEIPEKVKKIKQERRASDV